MKGALLYDTLFSLFPMDYQCVFASPTSSPGHYGQPIKLIIYTPLKRLYKVTKLDIYIWVKSTRMDIMQNSVTLFFNF